MTYAHPAGRVPMADEYLAIQRGFVEANAALFPVQVFHQSVVL